MTKERIRKPKKYTVDIQITTDVVVFANSKNEARKLAWQKFVKKPGRLAKIVDPHFYHRG
jgi:hypothetical protein